MTFSIPTLLTLIGIGFVVLVVTSGSGRRNNRYAEHDQRRLYETGATQSPYAMRPSARSSSFLSKIAWLLVVLVILFFLMNQYAPGILHTLQSRLHTSSTSTSQLSLQTSSENLVGSPTVTADFMNHVLEHAGSPAHGLGETLYEVGIQNHIDPAFALAFFHHESDYGRKGVAAVTHGLGNVRCTAGWTCDPSGGYRAYPSWTVGAQDWFNVVQHVYIDHGLTTVSKIIPVYAPKSDHNNEPAYIQAVMGDVTKWRSGQI